MSRYVAFLRGMNLGRRRIKNPELCACFTNMGLESVSAFLASGNVVFDSRTQDRKALSERIEQGLKDALNYDVPTFLRSADEVRAIASHDAFTAEQKDKSTGKPQVALLQEEPTGEALAAVVQLSTDRDRLQVWGNTLFWLPSGGISQSELDMKLLTEALGPMTVRTKNTIVRLTAKYL